MARKPLGKYEYIAPQFIDFDATESSYNDDYFNGPVSLWSNGNMEIIEETRKPSENNEKVNSKSENWTTSSNPSTENIKKEYRVSSTITPASTPKNFEVSNYESPELEYTRPWLNKSCTSLISAMDNLQLNSASNRISLTPLNTRNFNVSNMETSTPFITVKEKSKTRFVETRIDEYKTSECHKARSNEIITRLELQKAQNSKITTQVELQKDTELKTAKFSETNGKETKLDHLKHDDGNSSDQIVPINATNTPNNEENTQMKMIVEKSEADCAKEVNEEFSNNSEKNTEKLDADLPKPAEDSELDEDFEDAAAELLKTDGQLDATEQKEENGRGKKTRKPGVLVNKARRQSQKFRRQSGKFVSMAEAILKFQKGTPKRFYSTKRMMKSGTLQNVVQSARKVTLPTSPVLLCKSRCRRTMASNQEENENTEKNDAKRIGTSKKITQTAPSNLDRKTYVVRDKSENSKKPTTTNPATVKTSKNKNILPGEPEKIKKTQSESTPIIPTSLTTTSKSLMTKPKPSSRLATTRAKSSSELVPKTMKKPGAPKSKTDAEQIATGATKKLQTTTNTKSTSALSFEERNKLLLKKREEFAKRMIEQQKQARIFHARPAPTFKPVTVHGTSSENLRIEHNHQNVKNPKTGNSCYGSKNQENKAPAKTVDGKIEDNLKIEHDYQNGKNAETENSSCDMDNQEKKSPSKTVHGSSAENLEIEHGRRYGKSPRTETSNSCLKNRESRSPLKSLQGSATENLEIEHEYQNAKTPGRNNSSCGSEDQENRPLLKTQERCRKRQIFDDKKKKNAEAEEGRRKKEETDRLETMKNQEKELRKKMELKARPMPAFKHPQIAKSRKPLTDPQSPACLRRTKKKTN